MIIWVRDTTPTGGWQEGKREAKEFVRLYNRLSINEY